MRKINVPKSKQTKLAMQQIAFYSNQLGIKIADVDIPKEWLKICETHKCPIGLGNYDKEGEKLCCTIAWGKKLKDPEYKIVQRTEKDGVVVSTVWIGVDHSFSLWGKRKKPVIFETMVFGLPNEDEPVERYCTLKEAQAGHKVMCKLYLK